MNKVNTNDTLNRMKSLMNYGLQTESKKAPYSAVEYQKVGADGKVYGIVREGTKYYIKTAPNKQNLIKEDFGYIGGFRNRKENEYTSYANAQKNFDMKMMSLKEAYNNPTFNVESWDLNKKELVVTEASDKMKGEILRERQIMKNAMNIMEKKTTSECGISAEIAGTQKANMPSGKIETGNAPAHSGPFEECGDKELPKEMKESVVKEEEVLGWNRKSPDYMDKSHGTEIGDSAPFDDAEARNIDNQDKKVTKTGEMKNGVVENHGVSMHDTDNQNKPGVGVGEGPSDDNNKPFDAEKGKQIDEAVDGLDTPPMDDAEGGEEPMGDEPMGDEAPIDDAGAEGEPVDTGIGDEAGLDDEEGLDDVDLDDEEGLDDDFEDEDPYDEELENRLDSLEDKLDMIMNKLGVDEPAVDADNYEDDDLFGDEDFEDDDEFGDDDFEGEEGFGEDDLGGTPEDDEFEDEDEDEYPMESRRRRGVQIFETRAFKRAMRRNRLNEEGMTPFTDAGRVPSGNMNKLDDFGKHPAYQKVVMDLPPKDMKEFPGNYDMNDDSVKNDTPYGEKIGDGAPFDIDPEAIDNAIAEAFDRLKKKGNRG
jgi:hypothetical protein